MSLLRLLPVLLAVSCGGKDEEQDTSTPLPDDSSEDTGGDFPPDPSPFTLTVTGLGVEEHLVFDDPTCTSNASASQFRAFWRNEAREHVFVFIAEVLGSYTGPGSWDAASGAARVRLQEEAGGMGAYFAVDTAQGDSATLTVTGDDGERAWGATEVSGMHSDVRVTLDPPTIPIWCPTLN